MSDTSDVNDAMSPVSAEFVLNRDELEPLWRWQLAQSYKIRRGLFFMLGPLIGGVVLLADPGLPSQAHLLGILMLGVAALDVMVFAHLYFRLPARAWKQRPDSGTTKVEVSDQEVRVCTRNSDVVNRWDVYSVTIERDGLYLLRHGKRRVYTIVPKRAQPSEEADLRFRSIVGRHTKTTWTVQAN
ncbi:MAG TPA: YcxB family protein [Acidimicrobiales bacterium]